jgi:hypothetical protein
MAVNRCRRLDATHARHGAGSGHEEINRNTQQTHYLLRHGLIKCAKKVGASWVANPEALHREFGADEAREGDNA